MLNYEYTSCEEGASQYDEYDLSQTNIVDAVYIKALVPTDEGNPYIEALPYPRTDDDVRRAYTRSLPLYSYDDVQKMTKLQKMMQVGTLRDLRFPLPFHKSLEFDFYNALVTSYRARKICVPTNDTIEYSAENTSQVASCILSGDSAKETNAGFSLIGYSGCGKSSAIRILVSHYPQVIMHEDGNGGTFPQIVYLVVNCIANSNFTALYTSIAEAIDKALGNYVPVYAATVAKTPGLGQKSEKIREYIEKFGIGIIILDEIQLIDFEHTRENSFDSLMTLANRTKVAMAVVGTEDARAKMFFELRTARRIGMMINGNLYCEQKDYFRLLVETIFKYQWFDAFVEPTDEIVDALFDVTKGIVDQLVGVYSCVCYDYLYNTKKTKKPVVDGKYIRKIAARYYPGIQDVMSEMEVQESYKKLEEIKAGAELQVSALVEKAKQEDEAKKLIAGSAEQTAEKILLKNIVINIRNIFTEYDVNQIEEAFNKVMGKSSSSGLSEQEITRKVLEKLQQVPKRKVTKSSKNVAPDLEHMQNFLSRELSEPKEK